MSPYIDIADDRNEQAIKSIIEILQVNSASRDGRIEDYAASRTMIRQAIDSYNAAITQLVLCGSLNADDGRELYSMAERIAATHEPARTHLEEPDPCRRS